jgi:hypothetical protein
MIETGQYRVAVVTEIAGLAVEDHDAVPVVVDTEGGEATATRRLVRGPER